jgi:hypothetical protein
MTTKDQIAILDTRNPELLRYFRVAERKIFVDIKTKVPQYLEQDAR